MQRLHSQDALMAYGEAAGWPLHMGSLQVYDASESAERLDLERVRDLYRQRLPHIPAFRNRLVRVPAGLDRPVWVEDPGVDIDAHIHGVRLPAPGTDRQLAELVGDLFAPAVDFSRPLWDVWVIEGLEGGRVGVLSRVHHAAVDGLRALAVQAATYDVYPDAPIGRPGAAPGAGEDVAGPIALLGGAAARLVGAPVRTVRTAGHLARAAVNLAGVLRIGGYAGLALPMTAPRTSLNRKVSSRRGFVFCSLPLAPVKRAAKAEQVTVNDVVLALVSGAVRRYLGDRDELPDRSLVAGVPVGLPAEDGSPDGLGNRWAVITTSLATDLADPLERLHRIAASSRAAKIVQHAIGPELWQDLVGLTPAVIHLAARGYAGLGLAEVHPPLVSLVVSDLRGPSFPLYFAGARLVSNYPIGPIAAALGLNVTVISYRNSLDFGLALCPDVVDEPWRLVDALRAESDELRKRYPGRRRRQSSTAHAGS